MQRGRLAAAPKLALVPLGPNPGEARSHCLIRLFVRARRADMAVGRAGAAFAEVKKKPDTQPQLVSAARRGSGVRKLSLELVA